MATVTPQQQQEQSTNNKGIGNNNERVAVSEGKSCAHLILDVRARAPHPTSRH